MGGLLSRIDQTAEVLRGLGLAEVGWLLVLAEGLEGLDLPRPRGAAVPLAGLPHCPSRGTLFRAGEGLVLEQAPAYHQGFSMESLGQLPRALSRLGSPALILAGPATRLSPEWTDGAWTLVADHVNLMGDNPLVGPNEEEIGPRFPDLGQAWSSRLRDLARKVVPALGEGVLAALPGPSLETPAERDFLRGLGMDMVASGFLPEHLAAHHAGLEVLGLAWLRGEEGPKQPGPAARSILEAILSGLLPGLQHGERR